jgi:hypothetical protein
VTVDVVEQDGAKSVAELWEMARGDRLYDGLTLIERLCEASTLVGPVAKDQTMDAGSKSYRFRSIEAIAARAQPAFAAVGLVLVPRKILSIQIDEVKSTGGTPGRFYVVSWRWKLRCDGPNGPEHEYLETFGEVLEYGDKGLNKAQTASRKNALVAALNLADNAHDPDTVTPDARESRSQRQGNGGRQDRPRDDEPAEVVTAGPELWATILGYRSQLADEGRELIRTFAAERSIDLAQGPAIPMGPARRLEAYARSLVPKYPREADPNADAPHPDAEEPQDAPQPSIEELRDQMAAVQRDGATGAVAMPGEPATQAQPPPDGPVETWECDGPEHHAVKGQRGMKCPMPGCGGFLGPEEPF